jgi:peroxiredoxin
MALPWKAGDKLPDVRLGTMGGTSCALRDLRGRKALVYVWASWSDSREALPLLEEFHRAHPGVAAVSIACDVTGPEYPMRYLRRARATFEMWIDATCTLSRRWGVKEVPVSILLDEEGCVLLAGTMLDRELLTRTGELLARPPARTGVAEPRVDTKNTRIEILMQSCTNFLSRKRTSDAVASLRRALAVDPDNGLIAPQVWVLTNPEKFYDGAIDHAWLAAQPPVTPLE